MCPDRHGPTSASPAQGVLSVPRSSSRLSCLLDLPRWRLQDVGGFWRMLPKPRESARSAAFSKCPARGKRCSPIGCRLGCVNTSSSSAPPLPDGATCMPRVSGKQWVDHSSYQGGLLSCHAAGEGILGTVGSVFPARKRSPAGCWEILGEEQPRLPQDWHREVLGKGGGS